jgi:Fe-S oxidoreductase
MMDMSQEMVDDEELPGFYVPIDKENAAIAFYPNSKEVFADNDDMKWWWKIFYAAREDWTVPSENWEAVDWGLFTGNYEATKELAQRKINFVQSHNIKRMIMPDCGGGSYGCRIGMTKCKMEDPDNQVGFIYLYEYLMEIIKEGRIKLDKSVHAGKVFTWHDSCKHGRELERHYGHGYFDEPRWIINQCVDQFVEMYPTKMDGNCCGAGGGNWPGPYEDDSAWHGRRKYDSIKNSGADVVLVGCSNCHDQLMKRLPKYYKDYQYEVKYIWELVADALVIDPWTEEEVAKAEAEAAAQWEALGLDPNEEY